MHRKCYTASVVALSEDFVRVSIESYLNISKELYLSDVYRSVNYIGFNQYYLNPFGVRSVCTRPDVVYTAINLRKHDSQFLNKSIFFTELNFSGVCRSVNYFGSQSKFALR